MSAFLHAGRVGKAHGLDGSFVVTRPRAALLTGGARVTVGGVEREIARRAGTQEHVILRLAGVGARAELAPLRGADLLVSRAAAPPLGADEFWAEDLQGLRVFDGERDLGRVRRLVELPSCEVLELESELLVPLVRDAVRRVDVAGGVVEVDAAFLGV
ncbi:MAG: 16S rRNA processing protein RimM [Solirubrobacterales bacterium]|nr:16S rRNA processing protein RimM [Solirubrobacterales bacterium]